MLRERKSAGGMDRYVYDYAKRRVLSLRSGRHLRSRYGRVYITTDDGQRRWVPVRDFMKVVVDVKRRTSFNSAVVSLLMLSVVAWVAVCFAGRVIAFAERDDVTCGDRLMSDDGGGGRRLAAASEMLKTAWRCCQEYGGTLRSASTLRGGW